MITLETSAESPPPLLVLFDLDDTLFAHQEAVNQGITAHRVSLDGGSFLPEDVAEVNRWHALEELHYHRYLSGELDYLGQRRARVHDFVAAYGLELNDVETDRWYGGYHLEYEKAWALHSDAVPCLDELLRTISGVQFGVVTNGESEFQSRKVSATGLDTYIRHIIASGEVGVTKPDSQIFRHACALFGVAPESAVYIGDRLETDAIGAARAGLTGVWLDRLRMATAEAIAAAEASEVSVINSLDELPHLLATRVA